MQTPEFTVENLQNIWYTGVKHIKKQKNKKDKDAGKQQCAASFFINILREKENVQWELL